MVGCGGAGCNTISRLVRLGLDGAFTVAINTGCRHLAMAEADTKIFLGKKLTKGLGARRQPEMGRKAAEAIKGFLEEGLKGDDMAFVTASMGGGTGTGAAPVVASIAMGQGAIEDLRAEADTLLVIDNNRLLDMVPNPPLEHAFSAVGQLIAGIIKGVMETITVPSIISLDYAYVRAIMSSGGPSFMIVGAGCLDEPPEEIVRSAIKQNPLLDIDYQGALRDAFST